jgi:hypothetical protein
MRCLRQSLSIDPSLFCGSCKFYSLVTCCSSAYDEYAIRVTTPSLQQRCEGPLKTWGLPPFQPGASMKYFMRTPKVADNYVLGPFDPIETLQKAKMLRDSGVEFFITNESGVVVVSEEEIRRA